MHLQQYINFQLLIVNLKLQHFQEPIINLNNYGLTDTHLQQLMDGLTKNKWCLENLEQLILSNNKLSGFSLRNLQNLQCLDLSNNNLQNLDLRDLPELNELNVASNQLAVLHVNHLHSLSLIRANNNNLASFNTVGMKQLNALYLASNPIKYLATGVAPIYKDFEYNQSNLEDMSKFIANKGREGAAFSIASYPKFMRQILGAYVQNSAIMLEVYSAYATLTQAASMLPTEIIVKIIADEFGAKIIQCLKSGAAEINESLLNVTNAWYLKENNYSTIVADFINNSQSDLIDDITRKLPHVLYNNQSLQRAAARMVADNSKNMHANKSCLFSFPVCYKKSNVVAKAPKSKLQLT